MSKKMVDLMIDLETAGNTPQTPVVSLGAVFFDLETLTKGPKFYMIADVGEQMRHGRRPDWNTILWWMDQSKSAQKVFKEGVKPVNEVLQTFATWIKANGSRTKVWGNGSTFDISILEDMYRMYGLKCPWLYYNVMDVRTYRRFIADNEKIEVAGTAHNALDDADAQVDFIFKHHAKFKAFKAWEESQQ